MEKIVQRLCVYARMHKLYSLNLIISHFFKTCIYDRLNQHTAVLFILDSCSQSVNNSKATPVILSASSNHTSKQLQTSKSSLMIVCLCQFTYLFTYVQGHKCPQMHLSKIKQTNKQAVYTTLQTIIQTFYQKYDTFILCSENCTLTKKTQ